MNQRNVVIFIHKLQHYRIPILNILNRSVNLTVVCDNKSDINEDKVEFHVIEVKLKNYGPFIVHEKSVYKIAKSFDVVIGLFNLRCIDLIMLSLNPFRKAKFIYWGIGVTASYTKNFNSKGLSHYMRIILSLFADALIFYSEFPKKYYKYLRPSKSLFIANNTIANDFEVIEYEEKNIFLFVGSLYEQKGLEELIDSYREAFEVIGDGIPDLYIVGEGALKSKLQQRIKLFGLSNKITFKGAIYDTEKLCQIFAKSLLCISPKQAGLSVLTSMSNGVAFVTTKKAITGGEIFNIEHDVTGTLLNDVNELPEVLIEASKNPNKYIEMGIKGKKFYKENRRPEMMANSIKDAIYYCLEKTS